MIEPAIRPDPGSWRDPYGFVYRRDGVLLRQVNRVAAEEWAAAEAVGLLARLQAAGLLIPHDVASIDLAAEPDRALAVIRPEPVPFISYPYEWTFGQLKAAALLTLKLQEQAMAAGFELRDASAYNVQFLRGRPVFIDTLSFRRAQPGAPWIAYRQFCEHFLAPLALMAKRDIRLGGMLRDHLDGIPLDLAAVLLPGRSRLSLGLGSHVHLHARAQRRHADRPESAARASGAHDEPDTPGGAAGQPAACDRGPLVDPGRHRVGRLRDRLVLRRRERRPQGRDRGGPASRGSAGRGLGLGCQRRALLRHRRGCR